MPQSPARLLLIEDRASLARMLERALRGEGYEVCAVGSAEDGVAQLERGPFALVLTDLRLPGASGVAVVEACGRTRPRTPVVVMTAFGTVETAVEAMKKGALDFLEKPVELDDLFRLVASAVGQDAGHEAFELPAGGAIVGRHPKLRAALHLLSRVAPTESTVLLTGESGTGKELFARALHELSPRRAGPFVALNCAAIPDGLLETELFGHEKGAFTGASQRTLGRFEQAAGGTLFLDEIGELALPVQAKILRVLEERRFERVGGRSSLVADVRLVAATNQSLERMVEQGRFRGDLFFRLDVFPIALPPLRERPSDIPLLAQHLLHRILARLGGAAKVLEPEALELLAQEPWPGNVRQLGNVIERAAILSEGSRVGVDELRGILAPSLERGERERLVAALTSAAGDKHRAAEVLGWPYRKVLQKVKEHDLEGVPLYRSGE